MKPLLSLQDVTKSFPIAGSRKRVRAINGVTFDLHEGETLGLVGESGSGKSTVGRCIVGLAPVDSGAITFDGQRLDTSRKGPHKGQVQLVFQEPGESFNPTLRIGVAVEEPLLALGVGARERRVRAEAALDEVGLGRERYDASPLDLTAGQQQRAAIARAIITNPKLLVLDEPTSSLDPTARAGIVELLRRLQRERGTAYLFISHDLSTVRFLSHRIAVMYLGQIIELGAARDIFDRPRHPYTSGLLGSVLLSNPHVQMPEGVKLDGEIPSPIDLPPGCFLASRCGMALPACSEKPVHILTVERGCEVRCLRQNELAQTSLADTFERFLAEAERILTPGCPSVPANTRQDAALAAPAE
jgi:oligopeptide/dipeptide ABC transporter ATP-binding protein